MREWLSLKLYTLIWHFITSTFLTVCWHIESISLKRKTDPIQMGSFQMRLSVWPTPITWLWQSHFSHSPLLIGDEIQQVVSATTYGLNAQSCVPVIYTTNICDCVSKKMWNFKSGKWGNKDSFYSSQVLSVIFKKMYRFYTFKSKSFFVFCCWQVVPTHMTYSHLVISK